ncbi:septum formation initiator family protein [Actinorugispora endophytica]|uniref:Cell division protein FtsB n=1 Tax=Actinorugispora endophytica TaxID=1605990 RepID=A0A4R6V374_9ACTN|nr:septum formation initiator family protein [Actinorugispora endophytica]TDQ54845.1 cell division protein FtsB [Actinorugispora endophytica]
MAGASEPPKDRRPRAGTGPSASGAAERPAGSSAKGAGKDAAKGRPAGNAPKAAPRPRAGTGSRPSVRPALTSRAAVLALLVCVIALSLAYPLREYVAQRSEIAQLQDQRARTQETVEELSQRYEELQDPAYIEREARSRLHYRYPGEQAYVVIGGEAPETPEDSAPADPWFTQLWKSVLEADEAGTPSG